MASNLSCIGLDCPDEDALRAVLGRAVSSASVVGERSGTRVLRWQDDSGARLVVALGPADELVAFTPSFAGEPGAVLGATTFANDEVWVAAVLDESGEQVGGLAADLEQSYLLDPRGVDGGRAAVVALGTDVEVFADADAFAQSPRSLLDPDAEPSEPPAEYVANGWAWPLRMADESFVSYGAFGEPDQAHAFARLNGTVLASGTRTNSLTGTRFHVARVRTAGFETDLCLSAHVHPDAPPVGGVVGGTVYLVAALEDAPTQRRRGPFRRR